MRDAMSLLDQVIAFSGDEAHGDDVARVLGVADRRDPARARDGARRRGRAGVPRRGRAPRAAGVRPRRTSRRTCCGTCATSSSRRCGRADGARGRGCASCWTWPTRRSRDVLELAGRAEPTISRGSSRASRKAFDDVVKSGQPRMALEMALVRLARRPPLLPLDELLVARRRPRAAPRRPAPPPGPAPRGRRRRRAEARDLGSPSFGRARRPARRRTRRRTRSARRRRPQGGCTPLASPRAEPMPELAPPRGAACRRRPPARPRRRGAPTAPPDLDVWRAVLDRVRAAARPSRRCSSTPCRSRSTAARVVVGFEPSAASSARERASRTRWRP